MPTTVSLNPLPLIVEILKLVYPPLAKKLGYLKDIDKNCEILERRSEELGRKLNDLEHEVRREGEEGKVITEEARGWLEDARMVMGGAAWLIEEATQIRGGCCCRKWCLDCCVGYKLGKKISQTADLATELLQKRVDLPACFDPLPDKLLRFPTPSIKNNSSAAVKIKEVLAYLDDAQMGRIGIWGRRGAGKSTILESVYNCVGGTSDFGAILFVKFPKLWSLKALQREIAAELSLDLSTEEDIRRRSRMLLKELTKKKKFLLILDDVSEVVDLRALGIPDTNEQNGCKILFGTEKREILCSLSVDSEIRLDPLTREEAWDLFSSKVGYIHPEIQNIARLVCQECSGIPAFLNSFGAALRNQRFCVWERALRILKSNESQLLDPEELAASLVEGVDIDQMQQSVEQASVERVIEEILRYLTEDNIKRIGIWGMGGVGKTRILKEIIYQKFKDKSSFDAVIYATASRDLSLNKLRKNVAKEIKLELPDEVDEDRSAELLLKELKKIKFLLIIDDLWDSLEFKELGIPHETMKKGSKILFASRIKDVCTRMNPNIYVPVRTLTYEEAWALFQGSVGILDRDVKKIARVVCEECGGLPLALITVAAAMKNKGSKESIAIWRNALKVLRSSEFRLTRMEKDVFQILKFSYDMLPTDKHRSCFLYCALFPEDHYIEIAKIIEYWIMEGFLDDLNKRGNNLRTAYDEGYYLLDHLLDSCLLERDNDWKDYVRMHDMIRDTAIKITRDGVEYGRRFMVNARAGLTKCVPAFDMGKKDKISLMENDIESLPEEPDCPELVTLLLNGNDPLEIIPPKFFCSMAQLRVLDLSGTGIGSLPQSMSCLVNLIALILRCCYALRTIDCVGDLKKLQFLDLEEAGILELSEKLGNLIQLLRFNLSGTSNLQTIPASVISRMTLLEDLQTKKSSVWHSRSFIEALGNLEQLNSLSLEIGSKEAHWLSKSCKWGNINNFYIRVGCADPNMGTHYFKNMQNAILPERNGRCLDITCTDPDSATGIIRGAIGIIRYSEKLCLYNMPVIKTLSQVGPSNLVNLKECWISVCDSLETLVAADEAEKKTLPALEIVVLRKLAKLLCVWEGKLTPSSFGNVRSIVLYECPKIIYLFRISVLKQLRCLEELKVVNCRSIQALAQDEYESPGVNTGRIDNLRFIFLLDLPELKMLWNGSLDVPSIEAIEFAKCPYFEEDALPDYLAKKMRALNSQNSTEEHVDLYGNLK